jgi:hypothetical protein
MTEWTKEEDEAFNAVERQSNLGKQILKSQGQPYHWQIDAIESAIRMEREECAKEADATFYSVQAAENIRARGKK